MDNNQETQVTSGDTSTPTTEAVTGGGTGQPEAGKSMPTLTDGYTGIPEKFASDPVFQGFDSVDKVFEDFKGMKEYQDSIKTNGYLVKPNEKSTPEEINAFYSSLGKPESPAEYGFEAPSDLPEGLDYSDERAARFAQRSHELNLTKEQAQGVMDIYHEEIKSQYGELAAERESLLDANMKTLETAWGGEYGSDKFNANHQLALRAFNAATQGTPEIAQAVKDNPELASNPIVLQMFSALGAQMNSDSVPALTGTTDLSTSFRANSPEAVQAQIDKFGKSDKFTIMLNKPNSEEGKQYKREWNELNKQRNNFG